jgi:hypothetical protein
LEKTVSDSVRTQQPFIQLDLKTLPDKPAVTTRFELDELEHYFNLYEYLNREKGLVNIDDLVYPPSNFAEFLTKHRFIPFNTNHLIESNT